MDRDGLLESETWEQRSEHEDSVMGRSGKNFPGRENSR